MSAWIRAWEWCLKTPGVPDILRKVAEKRAGPILNKRARPKSKPPIRFPRGAKAKIQRASLPKLKKELDRVFSLFIRQRDCHLSDGWGSCATCGVLIHAVHTAQASHYQVRQDMATRWDETNVHAACGNCNGFRGGEPEKMAAYIDLKHGEGAAARLREKARRPFKLQRSWLESRIAHYKAQIGESASPPKAEPSPSPIPPTL